MRRPQREGRQCWARRGVEVDRGIVDRMARDQVIEALRAIGAPAARKGRAQRDDARDLARMMLGIFAGIDAAQAPPDQRRRATGAGDDPLAAAVDALDDVRRRAAVEAEAPGVAADRKSTRLN